MSGMKPFFEPAFMRDHARYLASKARVRTLRGWLRFRRTWFDHSQWPMKTDEQIRHEHAVKYGPLKLGGRIWGYSFWTYDLSPEARYEYFATVAELGDPYQFPHMFVDLRPMPNRWTQECPYCEIHTMERGADFCPKGLQRLVWNMPTE